MTTERNDYALDETSARVDDVWNLHGTDVGARARDQLIAVGIEAVGAAPTLRGRLASSAHPALRGSSRTGASDQTAHGGELRAEIQDLRRALSAAQQGRVAPSSSASFRFPTGRLYARMTPLFRPHWERSGSLVSVMKVSSPSWPS